MTEQATAPEWLQGLADESIKGDPSIQSFKSVDDLAKGFIETKKLVGKKGLLLPGDNADPKEWDTVWNTLGRPESPDGYKLPPVDAQKVQLDEEGLAEFRKYAHQQGIPQKHFEKVLEYRFNQQLKEAEANQKAEMEAKQATETALRSKWGAAYDERVEGINKIFETFGGENGKAYAEKYANDPDIKAIIGEMLPHLDEATIGELGFQKGGSLTPEEAAAKISEIRANKEHPFNNNYHKDHKQALDEMDKLYEMAYPGKGSI